MASKPPSPLATTLARHGFPTPAGPGLGFTPADDALFERGWPELRVLTDAAVDDPLPLALEALDAIDPVLPLAVPRDVAARYLVGYAIGPGPTPPVGRDEALTAPPVVDLALLERTLAAPHLRGMGDTYGRWRFPEVLYLFEAFLGAEPVARALVEHLLRQVSDRAGWGFAAQKPDRTNAAPHHAALALPWLLLRCSPAVALALRSALATVEEPGPGIDGVPRAYFALLRRIVDPTGPLDRALKDLAGPLALAEGDVGATRQVARIGHHLLWWPARICWLLGTDLLVGKLRLAGHGVAQIVDQVAPIRDPGVVRLVAHVSSLRAGRPAAGAWLRGHAAYVGPILADLARLGDRREVAAANAALGLLEGPGQGA